MARILMQVTDHRGIDSFVTVDPVLLVGLFQEADLGVRRRKFWEMSAPEAVTSNEHVDQILVLDGELDEESWTELQESLQEDDDD